MLINGQASLIDGVFRFALINIGIDVRVMPENLDEALALLFGIHQINF